MQNTFSCVTLSKPYERKQMKLKNIGPNCQEVTNEKGEIILFSYGVPVAKIKGLKMYLGEKWDYSRTTAKHVSQWWGVSAKEIREKIKKGEFSVVNLEN